MESVKETMNSANGSAAVSIRSGAKFYKSRASPNSRLTVFNHLNVTIQKGEIYGLLGPSGSGKTTILRCILGQLKLDQGTLLVNGCQPGTDESGVPGADVGYMPQETCLIDTMTIAECFWYFGSLVGMSNADIKERTKFYTTLLRLPPGNRITSELSGGQGRRVSFVLSVFHHPKLVILDEPTVGIDPIIKECMWKHLIELTSQSHTTVVLTTHYIEEAKASHRVGFLHNGRMAVESDTKTVLQSFNSSTLEEVYMKVVCQEPVIETDQDTVTATRSARGSIFLSMAGHWANDTGLEMTTDYFKKSRCKEIRLRWNPMKSIIIKNLLFLLRFRGAMMVTLLLPSLLVILLKFCIEDIGSLALNVIHEDGGQLATNFLSQLEPDVAELVPTTSLDLAKLNLYNHDVYGVIHIHPNFSGLLHQRLSLGALTGTDVLKPRLVTLYIDNTDFALNVLLALRITNRFFLFLKSWNEDSSVFDTPLKFEDNATFELETANINVTTHSICTSAMFLSSLASTVLVLFVELQKGTLERTFITGVSSAEVIVGMIVVLLFAAGLQNVITITMMYFFYNDIMIGSWSLVFLLYLSISFSGLMHGIFLSVMVNRIYMIMLICGLYAVILPTMNGVMMPITAAPYYFQYISKVFFLYYPVHAELDILQRGFGLSNFSVSLGFIVSLSWAVAFLILSINRLMALKGRK